MTPPQTHQRYDDIYQSFSQRPGHPAKSSRTAQTNPQKEEVAMSKCTTPSPGLDGYDSEVETVLHVYSSRDLARAVVEDELIAACGVDVAIPLTQGGRPLGRSGEAICLACLDAIGPKRAVRIIERRAAKNQRLETAPELVGAGGEA